MLGRFRSWFAALSSIGKVGVIAGASILTIGMAGAAGHQYTPPVVQKPTNPPPTVQGDKVEHKIITTTEAIAFDTKTIDDSTLAAGTDKTQTEGVNGVKTKTYDLALTNGSETNRTLVKEEVTTAPVTKIIAHGTYVAPAPAPNCPNGTYVNSVGNSVCSPYQAPGPPAGATAQCRDGTYSFSQSRSGTCSHHGGVAAWL